MISVGAVGHLFTAISKKANDPTQLTRTLLLIFSMSAGLGRQKGFFQ